MGKRFVSFFFNLFSSLLLEQPSQSVALCTAETDSCVLFIYLFIFLGSEDHFTHTVTERNIAASFAPMQFLWQRTEGLDRALFCL